MPSRREPGLDRMDLGTLPILARQPTDPLGPVLIVARSMGSSMASGLDFDGGQVWISVFIDGGWGQVSIPVFIDGVRSGFRSSVGESAAPGVRRDHGPSFSGPHWPSNWFRAVPLIWPAGHLPERPLAGGTADRASGFLEDTGERFPGVGRDARLDETSYAAGWLSEEPSWPRQPNAAAIDSGRVSDVTDCKNRNSNVIPLSGQGDTHGRHRGLKILWAGSYGMPMSDLSGKIQSFRASPMTFFLTSGVRRCQSTDKLLKRLTVPTHFLYVLRCIDASASG